MVLSGSIQKAREFGASDLHVEGGAPLVARVRGDLVFTIGEPLAAATVTEVAQSLLLDAWGAFPDAWLGRCVRRQRWCALSRASTARCAASASPYGY